MGLVEDTLTLKCLWLITVELSTRLLGMWMWNSGERALPEMQIWWVISPNANGRHAGEWDCFRRMCWERRQTVRSWGKATFKSQAEDEEMQRPQRWLKWSTLEAWGCDDTAAKRRKTVQEQGSGQQYEMLLRLSEIYRNVCIGFGSRAWQVVAVDWVDWEGR